MTFEELPETTLKPSQFETKFSNFKNFNLCSLLKTRRFCVICYFTLLEMVTFSRLMVTTNTHGSATLVRLNVSFVEPALMTDDPRLNKRAIFKNTKLLNLELLFS